MWNPWNKAKEAVAEVRRIGEQLEVVSTGKSLLEHAHKALVADKADLEKEVYSLKTMVEDLQTQLRDTDLARTALGLEVDEIQNDKNDAIKDLAASVDANGVLSRLAQGRLEKLNSAKSIIEAFQPSVSYLKSNKALRVELASAIKTIESVKEVL